MTKSTKNKRKSTKSTRKNRPTFHKKVMQVINRVAEHKVVDIQSTTLNLKNMVHTTASTNTIVISPFSTSVVIQQGDGQSQRAGNQIVVTSALLRFNLYPAVYNASSNSVPIPQVILCYIWSLKIADDTIANAQSQVTNNFFQNSSSSSGFSGNLSDLLKNVNTDNIKVYRKFIFKLGASVYSSNTGAQANAYNYANNDFKIYYKKTVNILPYLQKKMKFADNGSTPNNRMLFMTFSPCDADGGANADTTVAEPCTLDWGLEYKFLDM